MATVIPAEDWPPYRWLWTHLVLARDPETGEPTPYTHGVRRNTAVWLPILILLVVLVIVWLASRRFERVPVWALVVLVALGLLAGHFWW